MSIITTTKVINRTNDNRTDFGSARNIQVVWGEKHLNLPYIKREKLNATKKSPILRTPSMTARKYNQGWVGVGHIPTHIRLIMKAVFDKLGVIYPMEVELALFQHIQIAEHQQAVENASICYHNHQISREMLPKRAQLCFEIGSLTEHPNQPHVDGRKVLSVGKVFIGRASEFIPRPRADIDIHKNIYCGMSLLTAFNRPPYEAGYGNDFAPHSTLTKCRLRKQRNCSTLIYDWRKPHIPNWLPPPMVAVRLYD